MTFMEAKNELKTLANGKYHNIGYELTEDRRGGLEAQCHLYIDPKISSHGKTWKEALKKMRIELGLDKSDIDLFEAPGEERGDDGSHSSV